MTLTLHKSQVYSYGVMQRKMTIISKNFGGSWPLWPPTGYAYGRKLVSASATKKPSLKLLFQHCLEISIRAVKNATEKR